MTFEEFWEEHQHDPYTGREDFLFTWNAALEEAAKWADMTGPLNAEELRSLKEE